MQAAEAVVNTDKMLHSMLRTTCVATLIDGGHALNALPQRVDRQRQLPDVPGATADETQAALAQASSAIRGSRSSRGSRTSRSPPPPPLDPEDHRPDAKRWRAKYFPGVPVIPAMSTGATDAVYLGAVGIPTYGVPGPWADPDGNGTHGLNERIEVRSLYAGRDYLFDLVKLLAGK